MLHGGNGSVASAEWANRSQKIHAYSWDMSAMPGQRQRIITGSEDTIAHLCGMGNGFKIEMTLLNTTTTTHLWDFPQKSSDWITGQPDLLKMNVLLWIRYYHYGKRK